jgi:hypothetical protein
MLWLQIEEADISLVSRFKEWINEPIRQEDN